MLGRCLNDLPEKGRTNVCGRKSRLELVEGFVDTVQATVGK